VNAPLVKWAKKYHAHQLTMSYNNSNYQSTAGRSATQEVFVTNVAPAQAAGAPAKSSATGLAA